MPLDRYSFKRELCHTFVKNLTSPLRGVVATVKKIQSAHSVNCVCSPPPIIFERLFYPVKGCSGFLQNFRKFLPDTRRKFYCFVLYYS
jgi:hypothetical protein